MQMNDDTSNPEDGSENSGIGVDLTENKSIGKKQHNTGNTDQNPDKV